jgi:hypothetical protein
VRETVVWEEMSETQAIQPCRVGKDIPPDGVLDGFEPSDQRGMRFFDEQESIHLFQRLPQARSPQRVVQIQMRPSIAVAIW